MQFTAAQRSFLDEPRVCVLSTLRPDGAPHSAPMWYVVDGDHLLMVTGVGSQKLRNVERDPRVGVVIDRRRRPYYAVMIEGRAAADDMPAGEVRVRFADRYLEPEDAPAYLESRRELPGAVLRIVPKRVLEYGSPPGD